jgi:polysaccharide pyruvyl transferase WcaK-like protein
MQLLTFAIMFIAKVVNESKKKSIEKQINKNMKEVDKMEMNKNILNIIVRCDLTLANSIIRANKTFHRYITTNNHTMFLLVVYYRPYLLVIS